VQSKEVDVLVTWEASRASRDLAAYVELRELCATAGVLWSYSGRTFDLSSTGDRFTTGLDALLAEREAGEIAHRVQRAIRANAVAGRPHGRRLFGYRRVYDESTGALLRQEPHPDEAPIVVEVFRTYLGGKGPRTIARELNEAGRPTSTGAAWKDVQIRRMLKTHSYAARRQHQGKVIGPADWPAIIDAETFDRVQARLEEAKARHPRIRGEARLLSGVARCGVCGGRVGVYHDRGRRKVYGCKQGFCVARDLAKLDGFVFGIVVELLSRPNAADALAGSPAIDHDPARERVAELRSQLDEAVDEFAAGKLSGALLAKVEQRLQPQIDAAEREARRSFVGIDIDVPDTDLDSWWDGLSAEVRREVVSALLASVTIQPTGRGRRTFDPAAVKIEFRSS
jgi:DNA invertase Pin-like site-specific DNA recombinase